MRKKNEVEGLFLVFCSSNMLGSLCLTMHRLSSYLQGERIFNQSLNTHATGGHSTHVYFNHKTLIFVIPAQAGMTI